MISVRIIKANETFVLIVVLFILIPSSAIIIFTVGEDILYIKPVAALKSLLNANDTSSIFGEIPNAKNVYDAQTMTLSTSVKAFVIFIADEAHEPPKGSHKYVSDHNSYFIPTNLIMPRGVGLSFLDADAPWDTPHPHAITIVDDSSGKAVFSTGKMNYANSSKPILLPPGKYIASDKKYPWIRGTITVSSNEKSSSSADLIAGGFYAPTNQVSNNKDNDGGVHPGWLGYYKSVFPKNEFKILSEYNFHYAKCKYCPGGYWPDIKSADNTLLIYSTQQPLSQALAKLSKLVWNDVYI